MRSKALHILSILLLATGTVTAQSGPSFPDGADQPKSKIKILGNVYGGGDQAAVQGNTNVEINKGQYAGEIFGGGNGALYTAADEAADPLHKEGTVKASADVGTHNADGELVENTGSTSVTINGGEMFFDNNHPSNHNIYGGGNMACNVADATNVVMKKSMVTWYTFLSNQKAAIPAWYQWYDQAMNPNTQKTPIIAVFGAGYGAHTDVASGTNITIDFDIDDAQEITPANGESFTHAELETIDQTIMRWMPDHRLVEQFVSAVHGGGYDGTVGAYDESTQDINYDKTSYEAQTNVTILGQPFVFNVFGGGLGSKAGADANGGVSSHVGAVYGATKVDIQGGIINGDVFGGGAGIAGQVEVASPFGGGSIIMPHLAAAQVMRETDVTISGKNTVIFGSVYGGGDIANTGWVNDGARPSMAGHVQQQNTSLAYLDYTTSLHLNGGNILGKVFGGGNGRKREDIDMYQFVGMIIGSTNVEVNGSNIWGNVYGGGNTGCVFSCKDVAEGEGLPSHRAMVGGVLDGSTNVSILKGMVAQDIFGGGFGDDPGTGEENVSSADVSGNTFVFFKQADLEFEKYWKSRTVATQATMGDWDHPAAEETGHFLSQRSGIDPETLVDYRNTESDITHNLYGGGNMACTVFGNTHVYMSGAPTAPADFSDTDYYKECIANVAKPHFSSFGGGFGMYAKVLGNAYSDINLGYGTGLHSIIGGGMNGPVTGSCQVHVGNDPMSLVHHVYGGGYYAPCHDTELEITRGTILENVFGGSVMGTINGAGVATTIATKTVIGLQSPGDGRHSAVTLEDEHGNTLREYTYAQHQNQITIGGNVYGANDVSGTVNGIASLTIYGGEIRGNVYGAGNGDHIGYYVPDVLRYDLGAHGSDNYFYVDHRTPGAAGNTYVGRPQTIGGVNLTLEGNSETERVKVLGQVFGGGNSCTIGAWDTGMLADEGKYHGDPHLTRDDPAYFLGGGSLNINLRSHVTIGRTHEQLMADADGDYYLSGGENVTGLFMGCSGRNLATQNGAYVEDNYYHHYFDALTKRYYPGFAVQDENGNTMDRETQLKPFQAYLNNIMVWSNDVHLNIPEDAEDIWLANFVGGGFRGSMRTKTTEGIFDYALPEGVTVSHTIVGGAYNAHVQYHYFATDADGEFIDANADGIYDYATTIPAGWEEGTDYVRLEYEDEENPDPAHIKSIIRYNYNGGMLSENSTGVNSSDPGNHIHQIHPDPREEGISNDERIARYATSYFEPMNADADDPAKEDDATRAKLFSANKRKALMHLDLRCALEPEVLPKNDGSGENYALGGNVFGGCFMSGFVEGDSWVDYNCWLSPKLANNADPKYAYFFDKKNNMHIYDDASDLETNNALSVYGAGYGADTHSMGDVYLSIKSIATSAGGDADPAGKFPYIFNAFGGSNMGTVAGNVNVYYAVGQQGTLLGSLYGGSFKGDIEGNTFVEMAEGFAHNVYGGSRQADIHGAAHVWAYDGRARGISNANHLIICNLYGGNDLAGTISGTMPAVFTESKWNESPTGDGTPRESLTDKLFNTYVEISADDNSANRGFPLVGSAFAGGNGEYWTEGVGAKPEVGTALLEIDGGSTLRAFGGGNKATVTENTYIFTDASSDTFADVTFSEYQKNIVTKVLFSGMKTGYKWDDRRLTVDPFHVVRLFGGNNLATMDIQPTWNLKRGKLENVYSGGNMGDMTYYNPEGLAATTDGQPGSATGRENNADGSNSNYTPRGLSITIDQPEIYINSLFGGCRMSNVVPTPKAGQAAWPEGTDGEDYYGATVNITDGYIENVYGGNDVSGVVHHGTNVNISGAVSGNVYGSGNGFYLYKYDADNVTEVTEDINDEYGIFYRVPERNPQGNLYDVMGSPGTDTHKLLTINAVRPSVEKAFLNIAGLEHYPTGDVANPKRVAYVKGNVFCGGNASTITGDGSFSKFKIGSYVTLNGVFMGSDGKAFTENDEIARFASINEFTDMGAATQFNGGYEEDAQHNPILLNTYMMAVDMKAQPKDFNLKLPLREAHIGTYCGGGNRGSMLVDKTVILPFHHDIIIYDKIVAACLDANVRYNQNGTIIESNGGYTREIADKSTYGNTKMRLDIASQFVPLVMDVPDNKHPETLNNHGENFQTARAHDFLYRNQTDGVKYTYQEFNDLFEPTTPYESDEDFFANEGEDHWWKEAPGIYAPSCNIYGGCYQSGEVVGDIEINVHSNMLRYVNEEDLEKSIAQNIACFNVYGAGFGQDSHVWGNVTINVDRSLDTDLMGTQIATPTISDELHAVLTKNGTINFDIEDGALNSKYGMRPARSYDCSYPSANNIIGGGRNGKLIGNATVEIRNGLVYSDVAGGCYASDMYGSTHVIVGYPKYYRCKTSGEYALDRADKWNTTKKDGDGGDVIKQNIWYLKGDLVPDNIYQQIVAKTPGKAECFDEVQVTPQTNHATDGTTWDDVVIKIGKGIYGGGYSLANSTAASAGSITTHKLNDLATTDIYPHNFDGRYTYDDIVSTVGYGGNSSIMLGDQDGGSYDHIRVSTLKATVASIPAESSVIGKFVQDADGRYTHQGDHTPNLGETYYTLTGDGGIYGDGHLTFCEGFRTADVTRYGWADGTAKHPILMNTFQRMDLLSVNDCCLMLQGAQDFATDQIDATIYSITRINEMRLNSSLDATGSLGQISAYSGSGEGAVFDTKQQRNYLAFFNNVHYLGSIVTNDSFGSDFHNNKGEKTTDTYYNKKLDFINTYNSSELVDGKKTAAATTEFKKRNVATARNAIGINNGYCLRIQNQEYDFTGDVKVSKTYYGPIVGICEVKLLTLVQGEGGGYVYADNIHEYTESPAGEDHFLMTSGNFVFPGIIDQGVDSNGDKIGDQYIVDDCFVQHFGTPGNITLRSNESKPHLDEAHYWYVEGNKYFFTTTLTGFTYKNKLDFDLIKTDPNIVLSGMENGSSLNIKKIEWLSTESGFHRNNYEAVLPSTAKETDDEGNEIDKISDYEFDIFVGGNDITDWHNDMPRYTTPEASFTTGKVIGNDHLPQFNIRLQDKLDNSGDAAYINHLDEPELVKIYFVGETTDENGAVQTYEYTITVNVVYLQGPTVTGGVSIKNCALPGELIGFSTDGLKVKTPELMPITAASWQILPLSEIDEHGEWKWDMDHGIVIPDSRYSEDPESGEVEGNIRALYKQNEYTIAYIFTAGGYDFPVMPEQKITTPKENRMIVVHNYHRMKDVVAQDLQIETMPSTIPNNQMGVYHTKLAEAKIYIEDEADLRAFVEYLNMATEDNTANIPVGLKDLDIILQNDITLTQSLPAITQSFAGNFHGDGYHIDLGEYGSTLFGSNLTGSVYNLGLVNGTIANTGMQTNCYEYSASDDDYKYGRKAYELSHTFNPTTDNANYADYVATRYANGDYQYAATDRVWSLRTGVPNYGHELTRHDQTHTHDAARWQDTDNDGEADTNLPLYDGQLVIADRTIDLTGTGTEFFTYRGLPVGYANDYLFFGQHLDKENADAYPVHIEPVANGDADYAKGGNRVFETDAYYQNKTASKMYYNKDAWALKPSLTAIDYTHMTAEGDEANTLPTKFSVDSNKDYGHVTQNLLVYHGGSNDENTVFAAGAYGNNTAENAIAYHSIAGSGSPATYSTDYLHLVDKQDFNAPIAFSVKERVWYERLPMNYRNLVSDDYKTSSAWEGIVLPFTATKVTAEKNGEISHFYGTDETHHEYWLMGLKAVDDGSGNTVATFTHPAVSGDDAFVDSHQTGTSYDYPANSYFTSLYNYNSHWDSRDDDVIGDHSNAWYAKPHTFNYYVPLTAEIPYIVAFPGDDFYEFSMESYYKKDTYGSVAHRQFVTFESGATAIKVSDDNIVTTTANGKVHNGTYLHVNADDDLFGINATGTAFEANQPILPFRTYMTVPSSPAPIRTIVISDGYSSLSDDENEDPQEEMIGADGLRIWGDGLEIVVETACVRTLNVYASDGALREVLHCQPGVNRFAMKNGGLYMVGRVKLLLK